jgi:hypothetical protein
MVIEIYITINHTGIRDRESGGKVDKEQQKTLPQ